MNIELNSGTIEFLDLIFKLEKLRLSISATSL